MESPGIAVEEHQSVQARRMIAQRLEYTARMEEAYVPQCLLFYFFRKKRNCGLFQVPMDDHLLPSSKGSNSEAIPKSGDFVHDAKTNM
jgi:hypothetical protein